MSDEKAELAAFFNKKKGKSSKRKKLALALAMSDTPTVCGLKKICFYCGVFKQHCNKIQRCLNLRRVDFRLAIFFMFINKHSSLF